MGFTRHYLLYVVDEGRELYGSSLVPVILPFFFMRMLFPKICGFASVILTTVAPVFARKLLFQRSWLAMVTSIWNFLKKATIFPWSYYFYEIFSRQPLLFSWVFCEAVIVSARFSRDNCFYFRNIFVRKLLFWRGCFFTGMAVSLGWFHENDASKCLLRNGFSKYLIAGMPVREIPGFFRRPSLFPRNLPIEDPTFICKEPFFFFFARDPFFHEGLAFFALFFLHKWPAREPFFEPVTYFQGRK